MAENTTMPSKLAVQVDGLGKRYAIGTLQTSRKNRTLMEELTELVYRPARMISGMRNREHPDRSAKSSFWALRNISFDVQRGEVVGIIGRNGAGKSTLLKVLTRITMPDEGRARIRGRVGSLLEVGTGFHGELTGRENTYLSGAILGMQRHEIDAKFDEIVAFSGVERFIDTPVKRYSSGMYLRLAFSVAAHLEPDILLIDEVLAVGDAEFQRKCLGKMGDVAGEGRTVLFVSHNMDAVNRLCDTGIWLEQGQIRQMGPVEDVVRGYLTEFDSEDSEKLYPVINRRYGIGLANCRTNWIPSANGTAQDLRVDIEVTSDTDMPRIGVGVGLSTDVGVQVATYDARMTDAFFDMNTGSTHLSVVFPELDQRLNEGDYVVQVNLVYRGIEKLIDLDRAARVHVPGYDVFGTGKIAKAREHGPAALPVMIRLTEDL